LLWLMEQVLPEVLWQKTPIGRTEQMLVLVAGIGVTVIAVSILAYKKFSSSKTKIEAKT